MVQVGDLTKQSASVQNPAPKIAGTSANLATVSGTQAITGVGFAPSGAILRIQVAGTTQLGVIWSGIPGGISNSYSFFDTNPSGAGTYSGSTYARMETSAGNSIEVFISSFDSDGVTLTWQSKTGSPSGTAIIGVYCTK